MEQHVALFLDRDLEKAQFALKYLAAQMAVRPVHVHAFLRNGRKENGNITDRKIVAKLAEVRQYLQQTKLTFETIKITGSFCFEEISQVKPVEDCLAPLKQELGIEDKENEIITLEDSIFRENKNVEKIEKIKVNDCKLLVIDITRIDWMKVWIKRYWRP